MTRTSRQSVLVLALVLVAGCAANGDGNGDDANGDGGAEGGAVDRSGLIGMSRTILLPRLVRVFLGTGLNGISLTGQVLDGHWVEGASLHDVTLPNGRTADLVLRGSRFEIGGSRGGALPAPRLVGAELTAVLDDGSNLQLRIDGVERAEERRDRDVTRYLVSFPNDQGWQPLCGLDEAGEPIRAIPLEGRWDYREGVSGGGSHIDDADAFTFGCEGFVLAKCVMMGYRPWASIVVCEGSGRSRQCEIVDLADHHQACTRMLRADYCGDGTSFTEDGVLVNVYDDLGIRIDSEEWPVEAEWDADGALCVAHERIPPSATPSCWSALEVPGCGDASHFDDGTLLVSESDGEF